MKTSKSLVCLSVMTAGTVGMAAAQQAGRPNVLLITADDLNFTSVGCFGCPVAGVTPNIDALAAQGMRFNQGYVNVAVSQPSRGVMLTGMYPHSNGVEGFYESPKDVPTLMSALRAGGYALGIAGKVGHCSPRGERQWDMSIDYNKLGAGRDPESYAATLRSFIRDARSGGKPFFFMANSHDPHRPFHGSDADMQSRARLGYPEPSRVFAPDEIVVPGFLPDISGVRGEMAQYFSSVRRLDDTVGAILETLEQEGVADNTIVLFLSDNGISQPFAKTNCYLNSTHTPWIVRFPGVTTAGQQDSKHMVSAVDILPTLLEACGVDAPSDVEGRSFLPLLKGEAQDGRGLVFTQFYETSAKKRYPMFAVQSHEFGYIFTAWSDGETSFNSEPMSGLAFKAMKEAGATDEAIRERVEYAHYRVPEEFYDLRNDPDALNNLVNDPAWSAKVEEYRACLLEWMEQYDPEAAQAFKHRNEAGVLDAYMKSQRNLVRQRLAAQ